MLNLFEELLLLSIHEAKGTFIATAVDPIRPGLGGAVLAELALLGKIQISNNHRLQLIEDSQTEVEVLNDAIKALKESDKERKPGYWINNFSQKKDKFRKQIVDNLVQKGIVSQEDEHLVWVIPSPLQPEIRASAKYCLIKRLRNMTLASEEIQPRDIILLSLVRSCGLLDLIFLRDERKLASRTINQLFYSQAIMDPVSQTIQEIESAIADLVEED
jgi:Golgi phosphoprotein 3